MKLKNERDFRAEELYDLIELKYAEQFSKWSTELGKCTLDSDEVLEKSAYTAKKIVYSKCLLDAVHQLDMDINEIEQAIKLISSENSIESIAELLIGFGVESTPQSLSKHFKMLIHTTLWYEHNR